jgi:HAE1 family hydrophobic/amphiphilic exporter-1
VLHHPICAISYPNISEMNPEVNKIIESKFPDLWEGIATVSADISGRDMGSILTDIRRGLRSIPVPQDLSIVFGGDYEEQQKAFRELLLGLVLALMVVYMVMACLYGSLRDPFVVMFSVPLAAIGVITMLFLTNTTFSVQAFIGCIMLAGIVVNNAILLVDHTNLLRRRDGMPLREAIEEAGRRRLRPILMTAMTTVFGLIPLALGLGEGGEAQAPMARAVIGGLISSTLITLVFVQTMDSIFERESVVSNSQTHDTEPD